MYRELLGHTEFFDLRLPHETSVYIPNSNSVLSSGREANVREVLRERYVGKQTVRYIWTMVPIFR